LRRLKQFNLRRQAIAHRYSKELAELPGITLPRELPERNHVYQLYPIQVRSQAGLDRARFVQSMQDAKIGCSVHFIPVHRHRFYRTAYCYKPEQFPVAERLYEGMVSLPLYPRMSNRDVTDVIQAVRTIVASHSRHASAA
jgi:dTDP-4-amino-4,6-dideoxygalactose transaminase